MVMSIPGPLGVLYYLDSIGISFLDADSPATCPQGETGGSVDIGPPWRNSFGEFSGPRKPGLGQGENLGPNLIGLL